MKDAGTMQLLIFPSDVDKIFLNMYLHSAVCAKIIRNKNQIHSTPIREKQQKRTKTSFKIIKVCISQKYIQPFITATSRQIKQITKGAKLKIYSYY